MEDLLDIFESIDGLDSFFIAEPYDIEREIKEIQNSKKKYVF